jgi:hypothetical protein
MSEHVANPQATSRRARPIADALRLRSRQGSRGAVEAALIDSDAYVDQKRREPLAVGIDGADLDNRGQHARKERMQSAATVRVIRTLVIVIGLTVMMMMGEFVMVVRGGCGRKSIDTCQR